MIPGTGARKEGIGKRFLGAGLLEQTHLHRQRVESGRE